MFRTRARQFVVVIGLATAAVSFADTLQTRLGADSMAVDSVISLWADSTAENDSTNMADLSRQWWLPLTVVLGTGTFFALLFAVRSR